MILKCPQCKPHKYQDERYGTNMRVYNLMVKDGVCRGARCTVCGYENTTDTENIPIRKKTLDS